MKESVTLSSALCFSVRSDLQVVPSNCNREAVLALIVKQLKSLGVPFVHDIMYAAETLGEVHEISRKQRVKILIPRHENAHRSLCFVTH